MQMRSQEPDRISSEYLLQRYLTITMERYFYAKLKNESQDTIRLKLGELLKFLSLCSNVYGDIPVSAEIDELWHLWILQTQQYRELIRKLPTKKFIHHSSNDYKDEQRIQLLSAEDELSNQISYLASYVDNFGDFTESTIMFWPITEVVMSYMDLNIEGLNDYLRSLSASYLR